MEACLRETGLLCKALEIIVHRYSAQMPAEFVREYKIPFIAPCALYPEALFELLLLLVLENPHDKGGGCYFSALAVLGAGKLKLSGFVAVLYELLVYEHSTSLEIYAIPCQAENFTLAHTREQCHKIQIFKFMPADDLQKGFYLLFIQRLYIALFGSRQFAGVSRIKFDIAEFYCLLECFVRHSMQVLYCFRRKRFISPLGGVIHSLNLMRRQGLQLDSTESGLIMYNKLRKFR